MRTADRWVDRRIKQLMIVEAAHGVQSWLANNMEAYSIDTLGPLRGVEPA
ncbi:hypothetical protein OHAE_3942 [Ochrobactrum soli]|uniref:Uncharacterized protein n=1 Tax=Ochrobactrum soli TaxID=2448455 RepID=A0A2P9HJQ2_9HYPH|nr:hypothetical protein OHAE_3942 [[Ochrobactrum] soli]